MIASSLLPWRISGDVSKFLIPEEHLIKVLGLLVNPSVIELDCTVFDGGHSRKINNFLLRHSLKNCPNISKIKLKESNGRHYFSGYWSRSRLRLQKAAALEPLFLVGAGAVEISGDRAGAKTGAA
jgi:hypothetical protein